MTWNNKNLFSQFWKPEVPNQGISRVGSFGSSQVDIAPRFSPSFWWLLAIIGITWLVDAFFQFLFFFFFKNVYLFFEGERDTAWAGRGRHRIWSRLQALSCQYRAHRGAWTHKLWDHDLSWIPTLNRAIQAPQQCFSFCFHIHIAFLSASLCLFLFSFL